MQLALEHDTPAERIAKGQFRDVIGLIEALADGVVGLGLSPSRDLISLIDALEPAKWNGRCASCREVAIGYFRGWLRKR